MSNNNPTGINQHSHCRKLLVLDLFFAHSSCLAKKGDEEVAELLRRYHRTGTTDRRIVSELLLVDHGIRMAYVANCFSIPIELNSLL